MSVLLTSGSVVLRDNCTVDDAEPLMILLRNNPLAPIDVSEALHLHAAVLQVLLAHPRALTGPARDSFIQKWLVPRLVQNADAQTI